MDLLCPNCRKSNNTANTFCTDCGARLIEHKIEDTSILFKVLENTESRLSREISYLKSEVLRISQRQPPAIESKEPHITLAPEENVSLIFQNLKSNKTNEPQQQNHTEEKKYPSPQIPVIDGIFEYTTSTESVRRRSAKKSRPSQLAIGLQSIIEPMSGLFTIGINLYSNYKKDGKLPIFFMTIAGMAAILFGVGYFMQYSLQYLGNYAGLAKLAAGFTGSIALGIFGIKLFSRGKKYEEYSSALIALSIILNYVLIYFLSDLNNFAILTSTLFGFSLIAMNTLLAIYLSLKFETKVIAVLFLTGGAFAPFYLNTEGDGSFYYFYLFALVLGANIVSKKIKWHTLQQLAFLISLGLIESLVFFHQPGEIQYIIYFHLFAYLFFYYTLFDGRRPKDQPLKQDLFLLAANISFFLYNLYSAYPDSFIQLGFVYIGNALLFGLVLLRYWKTIPSTVQLLLSVVVITFIGFAIPSLFNHALMGMFWAIEAIALVVLGFVFAFPIVRREGYVVFAIAGVKLGTNSLLLTDQFGVQLWTSAFSNFIILGLSLVFFWHLSHLFKSKLDKWEQKTVTIIKEIIPAWAAIVFIIASYYFLGKWSYCFAIVPIYGFIYWKHKFNTRYTAFIGLAHILFFIMAFVDSALNAESYHFSDQAIFAKIALIELLITFWYLKKFCKDFINNSGIQGFVHGLRILFFLLLPLLFIRFAYIRFPEYITSTLWASTLLPYLLYARLKYRELIYETFILFGVSFLLSLAILSFVGLASSIIVILFIFVFEGSTDQYRLNSSKFNKLLKVIPLAFSMLTAVLIGYLLDSISLGITFFTLILLALIWLKDRIIVMNYFKDYPIILALITNFIGLLILDQSEPLVFVVQLVNLLIIGLLLINKMKWYDKYSLRWKIDYIIFQVEIIATYLLFLSLFGHTLWGPLSTLCLALHAILLVFISLKTQTGIINKVSVAIFGMALLKVIFYDIKDLTTGSKIVVFIFLGGLLLGASFAYVRLKARFDKAAEAAQKKNERILP